MTTQPVAGGYVWRQEVATIRSSVREARGLLGRLLDERPGPALAALYLAQIGVALLRVLEAAEALERVGERKHVWRF
jgi:hypothetical protein